MINACKKLCETTADKLLTDVDWKHVDKNELFYKASEYEHTDKELFNAYVAAIVYRYWGNVVKNILRSSTSYGPVDCYDWLVDATLGTISYRPWTKPELNLYNDPAGPDKCMNAWLKSSRQGYFQWSNAKKRSGYFSSTSSLDKLIEDCGDSGLPSIDHSDINVAWLDIKDLVVKEFQSKNYVHAFVIDGICVTDVIDKGIDEQGHVISWFNKRKLAKHLRHMNDTYCKVFAQTYNLPVKEVIEAKDICISLSSDRIYTIIRKTLEKLANDSYFKRYKTKVTR